MEKHQKLKLPYKTGGVAKRTMFGGYEIESMIFVGSCDEIVSFLKNRIKQWAIVRWAKIKYDKDEPTRTDIRISIKHTAQCKKGMGDVLVLMMGQRLCVCEETKSVFILDGDTIGIEILGNKNEKENVWKGEISDEFVAKEKPKLGTPLTELSPVEIKQILKDRIKNKRVYANWDYDGNPENVLVWVEKHLLETYDEIKKKPYKYVITMEEKRERVWAVSPHNGTRSLIGKGLSAIIDQENSEISRLLVTSNERSMGV